MGSASGESVTQVCFERDNFNKPATRLPCLCVCLKGLAAILITGGRREGPDIDFCSKMSPRITMKMPKQNDEEGLLKKHEMSIPNGSEKGRPGHAKPSVSLETCCKTEGFAVFGSIMKNHAKMNAKIHQESVKIFFVQMGECDQTF